MINTGSMLRVDQGDGRGRYTGAWWEWDCRNREGKEIVVGLTDREEGLRKEKKERKRKVVEKYGLSGIPEKSGGYDEKDEQELEEPIPETQAQLEETQIQGTTPESQGDDQTESQMNMEDDGFGDDMLVDV